MQKDTDYIEIINKFEEVNIAVVGDFMLDKYIWGGSSRISPEAPVPVVNVESTEYRLGGAANVAANLASLGCSVDTYGLIGDDRDGKQLVNMLEEKDINSYLIKSDNDKRTTVKTRIIADEQQITRVDKEDIKDISSSDANKLMETLKNNSENYDAVILSDYLKGVLNDKLTQDIILYFKNNDIIMVVDPKGNNYKKYQGATTVKPNLKEFKQATQQYKMELTSENLEKYAHRMRKGLELKGVVVTLGKEGVFIQNPDQEYKIIPTRAKEVYDVSGAGDTFTAIFSMVLSVEEDWFFAGDIANHGSGIVVGEVGTSYIDRNKLINDIVN